MMILSDPQVARFVCSYADIQPFVDLEVLGKAKRQGHLPSWKSKHTYVDVTNIREAVPDAHLIVRINPLHDGSQSEITEVVARGADSIMLPMFHDLETLSRFLDLLNDQALPFPLFETAAAVAAIPEMVPALGINRLHIGLNDLHLDLKKAFLFQPLAEGYLEAPTQALRENNVEFGIGGLARLREGIVSPEYLLGEHVRLGSSAAILSQTFHRNALTLEQLQQEMDFPAELSKLRKIYAQFKQANPDELEKNRVETRDRIQDVVHLLRERRNHDEP